LYKKNKNNKATRTANSRWFMSVLSTEDE